MPTFEPSPDLDPAVARAIRQAMDALRAELLARFSPHDTESIAAPDDEGGQSDRLRLLDEAVQAIDAAPSQASLLSELLLRAGHFADRAVFFVRDQERYRGWAAFGFDTDQERVTGAEIDAAGGAWAEVAGGELAAELEADACARVVSQIGGETPTAGILVGFPLRGATAGALYADRIEAQGTLDPSALRILTYVAAQALETLPLRRGPSVESPDEAPSPDAEATTAAVDVDEMIREVAPQREAEQEILEIRRDVATPATLTELAATQVDEVADDAAAGFETVISEVDSALETPVEETRATFEPATPDIDTELPGVELPSPGDELEAGPDESGFATQEISTLEETLGREMLAESAPPVPGARTLEPAEVAPPPDLEGPGWAFGGADTITDDSRQEEARRLARLLVTEIKLYNEEKVREGREHNNLLELLRDDLERSRRIYDERIDEEVRRETDYFQEECVRILAGGDTAALGK